MDKFQILIEAMFSFLPPKSPVDYFPIGAIALFAYKITKFVYVKASIEEALKSAIAHLHPYKRNQGEDLDTVQKISQSLQGKYLSSHWIEFKESLVVTTEGDKKSTAIL